MMAGPTANMFDDLAPAQPSGPTASMFSDLAPPQQAATVPGVTEGTVRSMAEGVPILGALANKLDAATNAALAPALNSLFAPKDQLTGPTFADRYNQALAIQEGEDKAFGQEHPVLQTAGELAGGIGGTAAAGTTSLGARLLGLTGNNMVGRTVMSGLSGAGINAADTALRGGNVEEGAGIGAATGLAGPIIGRAVGKVVNAVRPAATAPLLTSQELIDQAGYNSPAIKDLVFQPNAMGDLSDSIASDLNGKRINARLAPQTHGIIEDLKTPVQGNPHTMEDLTTARQLLGDVAGSLGNKTDAKAAVRAKQMIDSYMANVPDADVAAGDPDAAAQALKSANADYAAGRTAQALEGKISDAGLQAASANSGMNFENALRQNIKSILKSPKLRRVYSADEISAMQSINAGTASQNVLRAVGNLLGGGGGLGAMVSGGGAALAGAGPAAVLVPAAGYGIKRIGNAIAANRANALDELIRSRAPANQGAVLQNLVSAAANRARLARMQNVGTVAGQGSNPVLGPSYQ